VCKKVADTTAVDTKVGGMLVVHKLASDKKVGSTKVGVLLEENKKVVDSRMTVADMSSNHQKV
jgi:hypothetical protein